MEEYADAPHNHPQGIKQTTRSLPALPEMMKINFRWLHWETQDIHIAWNETEGLTSTAPFLPAASQTPDGWISSIRRERTRLCYQSHTLLCWRVQIVLSDMTLTLIMERTRQVLLFWISPYFFLISVTLGSNSPGSQKLVPKPQKSCTVDNPVLIALMSIRTRWPSFPPSPSCVPTSQSQAGCAPSPLPAVLGSPLPSQHHQDADRALCAHRAALRLDIPTQTLTDRQDQPQWFCSPTKAHTKCKISWANDLSRWVKSTASSCREDTRHRRSQDAQPSFKKNKTQQITSSKRNT